MKYTVIKALVSPVDGRSHFPGSVLTGADADAVENNPLLRARCVPNRTPDAPVADTSASTQIAVKTEGR